MGARDVLLGLGDAIAGVDRQGAYRKGVAERAGIEETEAQTEAALAMARDRRLDAEKKERQRAAEDALREREHDLNNPDNAPVMDIMSSGLGDEYAGAQLGRSRALDVQQGQTIATPSLGMGDELLTPEQDAEAGRVAAMEAQAPAAAIASRRPGNVPNDLVLQPDGSSVYMPRPQAAGQRVGARPSTSSSGAMPPSGIRTSDSSLIYRQAAGLFGGTYDPTTGRFAGLDKESAAKVQRIASRAAVLFKAGNLDHATAVDQALDEMKTSADSGGIPPQFGDDLAAPDAGADGEVDPSTGQPYEAVDAQGNTVRWINGQWVHVQ